MTPDKPLVGWLSVAMMAVLLFGLFRARLHRECRTFVLYVAVSCVAESLVTGWPTYFWTWTFWTAKEILYIALKLTLVLELTMRCFDGYRGAQAVAQRATLLGCTALLAVVWTQPSAATLRDFVKEVWPWIQYGTAALFILVWTLTLWYRIPLQAPWRTITRGFAAYLLVITVEMALFAQFGEDARILMDAINDIAWALLIGYWTYTVWKPGLGGVRAGVTATAWAGARQG